MPNERDFLTSSGNFDVGPGGSPALHNCVAYKLCYYKFGAMQTGNVDSMRLNVILV